MAKIGSDGWSEWGFALSRNAAHRMAEEANQDGREARIIAHRAGGFTVKWRWITLRAHAAKETP